ncbi:SDR family oxidoreductase [Thalassobaculum salexigens]|uniref:SDR family oxidoreductase n=1 Tax=Thalassobaculum salexigens TaxID=455360 RepID=UPI00248D7495|nr:SDR family oxidoreductase [Thalassobaculum salexigens]
MDLKLAGKVALVTGASAGIGAGIARVLAAEGATLALTARRRDRLEDLAAELAAVGAASGAPAPTVIEADLMADDGPAAVRAAVLKAHGRLDILINNAGSSRTVPVDAPDSAWDEAMMLKFTMGRRLTTAFLPELRAHGWGRIIHVTGILEPTTTNAGLAGCAATHAWAKGMSRDLAPEGITVNCLPPGRIVSEQIMNRLHPTEESRQAFIDANIPAGRFGEPEEFGNLVAFLCSPLADYITGCVIPVDGGMHRFIQ